MTDELAIKVENLSKQYRLGIVGTGTISHDLNRWWHLVRGKEDPFLKLGEVNDRSSAGNSKYVWSLKDINFDVKQGEVLGIIGKNGAGKSTLLKILSKVTGPTTGRIMAKGRIGALLEVGTGFHPELTGKENIFLNGAILGMTKPEIKAKLDEIIDFSGCARYIDTPTKRYSSGMKVRLAFAVAAFLEPEILIVDEVLAVGDAEFQKKAIGKMQDVSKGDGRTVLFVSHDMGAIDQLCSRTIVLENGIVAMDDSTPNSINYYLSGASLSRIPVRNREDRQGNQTIKIVDLKVRAEKAETVLEHPMSGSDLVVEFHYEGNDKAVLEDVLFGFLIRDKGRALFSCNTKFDIGRFSSLDRQGKVECRIKDLPLVNGEYTLDFFVKVKDAMADKLDSAIKFDVEKGNFYPTNIFPGKPNQSGRFLVKQNWTAGD